MRLGVIVLQLDLPYHIRRHCSLAQSMSAYNAFATFFLLSLSV